MEITEVQYQRIEVCFPRQGGNVELPKEILERARLPFERMLEMSGRPFKNAG
jgi:quinolinate synthase